MAVTVSGTSITFNDSTVQTTAFGGLPANFAVGNFQTLFNCSRTNIISGDTAPAGPTAYATNSGTDGNGSVLTVRSGNVSSPGASALAAYPNTAAVTGTWRACGAVGASAYNGCANVTNMYVFLAVRIA
jgi:hypothetical protein